MIAARWSDNDHYFGPFTFAYSRYWRTFALVLRSGGDNDGDNPCTFRLSLGYLTFITVLPDIIKPWREKVYPGWDAETIKRLGRDWYWSIDPREYSISLTDGHVSVHYGRTGGSCMDSSIAKSKGWFLPWTVRRAVAQRLYDDNGVFWEHIGDRVPWRDWHKAVDTCPRVRFSIEDYDGAKIEANTLIVENESRRWPRRYKWLGYLWPKNRSRRLDINFADEIGPEKGSWKGGTMGTSIEMQPGDDHESAFKRFCAQDQRSKYRPFKIKYLGRA